MSTGVTYLTDPIFSQRCSPVQFAGPERLVPRAAFSYSSSHQPAAFGIDKLPKVDFVVVSHCHYDHLDRPSVLRIGNSPLWIVPLGLADWFRNEGITNVVEVRSYCIASYEQLDWWQEHRVSEKVFVTATPAKHWSKRGLVRAAMFADGTSISDTNKSLWCGYVISGESKRVFFAGDTGSSFCIRPKLTLIGYCPAFKEIGERFQGIDISVAPTCLS